MAVTLKSFAHYLSPAIPLPSNSQTGAASRLIQPPVRSRMTADDYSKDFMLDPATGAANSKADPEPCHQFDADKQLGRTSEMFDINGIVTLQCR